MAENYFTSETAWTHLYMVEGLTADEFYTDSGWKLNIEQLTYLELKCGGYQRVIFYDKDNRLYCYDDESYSLLRGRGGRRRAVGSGRSGGLGLGMGSRGRVISGNPETVKPEPEHGEEPQPEQTEQEWSPGLLSKLRMRNLNGGALHLGIMDTDAVSRQIDGYIRDDKIRTAVVINDAEAYLREFGNDEIHYMTTEYQRLDSKNQNILVFLFADSALASIFETHQFEELYRDGNDKRCNLIHLGAPNPAELRNMLWFFKSVHGLNIRASDVAPAAQELRQAMGMGEQPFRIREIYVRLKAFGTEKRLTPDGCYDLLGVKKRPTAKEQMNSLIGLEQVKKALDEYDVGDHDPLEAMKYYTASRLQPDLEKPLKLKKDEMIHFVLSGNSGTGAATVAHLIGQFFYEMGYLETNRVVAASRADLVGGYVGQTAIKTQEKVMEAMGGVLFINGADTLTRQKHSEGDFGQECVDTLLQLMDQYKGKFILVAAGYPKGMQQFMESNPGLSRTFRVLKLEDYTPEEMQQLLEFHARRAQMTFSEDFRQALPDFCENWVNLAGENWGNAGEAVNLMDDMVKRWKKDPEKTSVQGENGELLGVLERRHLPEKLHENLRPVSEMREEVLQRLNGMTGLHGVKAYVEKLRLRMLSGDMKEPGHYIFSGNPGTGKTTVARYMGQIMRNLGLLKRGHLVEYSAHDLIATVFNEDNGGDFTSVASKALEGVLFIDEAYQLVQSEGGRAILNVMVPFMENNRNICIICAGYEDDMEELCKYNVGFTSRFTANIHFDNYTGKELCSILLDMLRQDGREVTPEYEENALRALTRYVEIHGKEKDFGNARYIRTKFILQSLDAQTARLIREYGENFDLELKKTLTGEDIPADLVRFTREALPVSDTRTAAEKVNDLIGFGPVKEELLRLLSTAEFNRNNEFGIMGMKERLHWVLEGNPGTGKTMIAKLIGQVYKECGILSKGHTVKVTRADLVGKYQGWSAEQTRKYIQKAMGGVLFIDEAYQLTKVENGEGGYGQEVIGELVEAMEACNGEFAVICAGYPNDMEDFLRANSGLSSRMKTFVLEDYKAEELTEIFRRKCRAERAQMDEDLDRRMEIFFENMKRREGKMRDWGNGREAENLLREMLRLWNQNQIVDRDGDGRAVRLLTRDHIPEDKRRYLKGKKRSREKEPSVMEEINSLIGFGELKEKLTKLINLSRTAQTEEMDELMEDMNLHWVLKGNPGTGKTTVAELVGKVYKEIGLLSRGHTVKVTRSDLVGQYVGQTAVKTRRKIDEAMGGVLFIDEAYTLSRDRTSGADFGQEAIDTLLESMSDRNGEFAVIAAGYPKEMDDFLNSNPGFESRFNRVFELKDYTAEELTRIFGIKCRKKNAQLTQALRAVIEPMFRNMIRARLKNWANGREAENLEKWLRENWANDPMFTTDGEGRKCIVYDLKHLPDRYRRFLPGQEQEEQETVEEKPGDDRLEIPRELLAQPPKEFDYESGFHSQEEALVLIQCSGPGGRGSGSGSIISSDGYVLTCHHVIDSMERINVRMKRKGQTIWEPAVVAWCDRDMDFAILKIKDGAYPTMAMQPLEQGAQTGDPIYHWGFPFGGQLGDDLNELNPSLFQGFVSSVQTKDGLERINTNMEAKRGCSGGPVLSKKYGTIVGILCGSQMSGDEKLMEEMNYVLPIRYVWENVIAAAAAPSAPGNAGNEEREPAAERK